MTLALALAFVVLMLLAVPVGHALVIGSAVAVLWDGHVPLLIVVQQLFQQTQSFPMLALPFFMLAGSLMMGGRLGGELLTFASEFMKRFTGGELSTTVVAATVFGGVSGSAVANASALGPVLIPWQKKCGYPGALCAANIATSAVIDILIPPSIPMILYSLISGTSVADLFIAGVLPGLLMAGGFIALCWWIAKHRGYKKTGTTISMAEMMRLALKSIPALVMPIWIIIFMRFGIATPTEVAVLAVVYSIVLSVFFYRDLDWTRFKEAMVEAGIATGVVMLVIMGSAACGWLMTFDQVPTRFAAWVASTIKSPFLILMAMNVVLIIVGGPLDLPPALLLFGPIFLPLGISIGLDPVQLGLIMIINLGIGLYTPPIGTTLFIAASISKDSLDDVVKELWPFFIVAILVLLAITYIPELTLY